MRILSRAGGGTVLALPARVRVLGLGLVVVLAACGARVDGDGLDPPDGTPSRPDAEPQPDPPDATTVVPDNDCGVPESQGDLGTLVANGDARSQGGTTDFVFTLASYTPASADTPSPDAVYVELWDNYGVFAGRHATPGTYEITGEETSYATCGVCVFTLADLDGSGTASRILEATSGSITIYSVAPAMDAPLSIEVHDATFQEVSPQDYSPLASDCPSPLARARLDGSVATLSP